MPVRLLAGQTACPAGSAVVKCGYTWGDRATAPVAVAAERRGGAPQAPGPPGPLTTLPAVSPPSMTSTEPVK